MFYDDLESTISNLGFWKTLSFPPQSFYLFFNCLLKNIFRFLPIAAITITQMPSIQNNMAPLINWWITYVFHEKFREIDFTKKCAALSDLDDNEITTEAGAFYDDGLNILRLCLQAAQERNSSDTLLYYYVTTGLLAFQRITVSLLIYLLFHAFWI